MRGFDIWSRSALVSGAAPTFAQTPPAQEAAAKRPRRPPHARAATAPRAAPFRRAKIAFRQLPARRGDEYGWTASVNGQGQRHPICPEADRRHDKARSSGRISSSCSRRQSDERGGARQPREGSRSRDGEGRAQQERAGRGPGTARNGSKPDS